MRWHLLIDYDAHHVKLQTETLSARLERAGYRLVRINRQPSPSGEGEHVRILIDPEPGSPMEIVALQAVCGSDPSRESCNILRARNLHLTPEWWHTRWNVLYGTRGTNADIRRQDRGRTSRADGISGRNGDSTKPRSRAVAGVSSQHAGNGERSGSNATTRRRKRRNRRRNRNVPSPTDNRE